MGSISSIEIMKKDLKKRLSKKRYQHSLRTMEEASKLAKKYHYNVVIAKKTALLHDVAKEMSHKENKDFIIEHHLPLSLLNENNKKTLHAVIGSIISKEVYHFSEEMADAILHHTTACENMGLLDKIVYLADKIEKGRNCEGIEKERFLAYQDIDLAMILCLQTNLTHLIQQHKQVNYQTLLALKWYEKNKKEMVSSCLS